MNELLALGIVNLTHALFWVIVDYIGYARRRLAYLTRVAALTGSLAREPADTLPAFVPGRAGRYFTHLLRQARRDKRDAKTQLIDEFTPRNIVMVTLAMSFLGYTMQHVLGIPWYVLTAGGALAQAFVYIHLKHKRRKIQEELDARLPEILEIMARVYRVHSDLRIAVSEVAAHISQPSLKELFGEIVKISRFGYTVEEAMDVVARRVGSDDFDFLVTSIRLNTPVGGNLAYLFEKSAAILRQRKETAAEINNLMFQNKVSAVVSAFLVPVITLVSFATSDKYQEVLLRNPTGRMVFLFCFVWWLAGVVIIRSSSRVRV